MMNVRQHTKAEQVEISRNQKRTEAIIGSEKARPWFLPRAMKSAAAALLLFLVFRFAASAEGTVTVIRGAKLPILLLAVLVAIAGELVTAYKWKWLLQYIGQPVSLWFTVRASYIGMFYNNLLPGSVGGDIAKTILAGPASGGLSRGVASVFMQRNTGFGALLIIANAAVWLPPLKMTVFREPFGHLNYAGVWFAAVTVAYVSANLVLMSSAVYSAVWAAMSRMAWSQAAAKTASKLQRLHDALLLYRGAFGVGVGISIISQLIDCYLVFLIFHSLGIAISYWNACVFAPAATLAALVPITLNGVGLREAVYIVLLTAIFVTAEQAVAASLVHYSMILLMAFAGGAMQLFGRKSRAHPHPMI